jgi:hypothetical protein
VPGFVAGGWVVLGVPAAALEAKGPFESLGRSIRLLKGHAARGFWLLVFSLGLHAMLAANVFAVVWGALLAGRHFLGLQTAYYEAVLSPANGIFATVVLLAVYVAVEPWKACAIYHLHLDQRVRFEALDLRGAVDRLEAARFDPAPAAAALDSARAEAS